MFSLLLAGLSGSAHASYICSLTSTEITDVDTFYSIGFSLAEHEAYVDAPFDCTAYGSLCEIMSESDAEGVVCDMWDDLRDEVVSTTLMGNTEANITTERTNYDFPGMVATTGPGCSEYAQERETGMRTRKVRVTTKTAEFSWWGNIRADTEGLERDNTSLPYRTDGAGIVTLSVTLSSQKAAGGWCNAGNSSDPKYNGVTKTGNDGYVKWNDFAWEKSNLPERLQATGTYDNLSACAYAVANWDDGDCV